MREPPDPPFSVRLCQAIVSVVSRILPGEQRQDWQREWQAEVWHSWHFLSHAGAWDIREQARLVRRCLGVVPDAVWQLTGRITAGSRDSERVRSPWACLGLLAGALVLLAVVTRGLPATRNLIQTVANRNSDQLLFIWLHPSAGGGDQGLPSDIAPAWASRSRLLESVASFVIKHEKVRTSSGETAKALIVSTESSLFDVLRAKPLAGKVPQSRGVVLTCDLWRLLFRGQNAAVGSSVRVGKRQLQIAAILPPSFRFLSRQPTLYVVEPFVSGPQVMVAARLKQGVSQKALDKELTRIAETDCYYFFRMQLRYSFLHDAIWTPVRSFGVAATASLLLLLAVSRLSLRRVRAAFRAQSVTPVVRRSLFLCAKLMLALLFVFVAGLEWSRSENALLYASRDPAAGPFLLWLYILGTMGVLFWSVADQRARCRVCLRLLCMPVRVGCPGCLLLNWSGTELLCTEGHGVLHVPHLASSWDEDAERWISLDETWKELFAHQK